MSLTLALTACSGSASVHFFVAVPDGYINTLIINITSGAAANVYCMCV